jgi:hypothetical protein
MGGYDSMNPSPAIAMMVRCKSCTKPRYKHEIAFGDERAGYVCTACYYKHHRNIADFRARRPRACDECGLSFAQMDERQLVQESYAFEKDGLFAMLCKKCWQKYEQKAHQLRGTAHERIMKIR